MQGQCVGACGIRFWALDIVSPSTSQSYLSLFVNLTQGGQTQLLQLTAMRCQTMDIQAPQL